MADDSPPRPARMWMLAGILVLVAGMFSYITFSERIGDSFRNPSLIAAMALTGVLLTIWFMVFSGVSLRTRLGVMGGVVALVAVAAFFVKFTGFRGDMTPQFAWRSEKRAKDFELPDISVTQTAIRIASGERDYPQFLGPRRDGTITDVRLATDWKTQPPREIWRVSIGAGWSAFAVVGEHAFTQEQRGDKELVSCYDLKTGQVRWAHAEPARFSESMGGDGPRATPTVSDGKVFALGGTGLLQCLDGESGKLLWKRDVLAESQSKNLQWGKACSPLLVDDLVVVSLGESGKGTLAAYKAATGEPSWISGTDKASYSSPALATLCGVRQILSVNGNSVTAHAITDGTILWTHRWPDRDIKVSQPVAVAGDRVFISAGYGIGCALLQVSEQGGAFSVKRIWSNLKLKTKFTNVVMREGFVYGLDEGTLQCVELETGEGKWKEGRYGHGQVLLVDDTLLIQAESGEVALVSATPTEYRELTRFPALSTKTWNNPVLCGPRLLVRNDQEAACFELPLR